MFRYFCWIFSLRFLTKSVQLLQWLVFFLFCQTTELTLYASLFGTAGDRFKGNPAVAGSSPCCSQQHFCAFAKPDESSIFCLCAIFFKKIKCLQKVPLQFLLVFCNKLDFQKGPPFYNFHHCEIFQDDCFLFSNLVSSVNQHAIPELVFEDRRFFSTMRFFPI